MVFGGFIRDLFHGVIVDIMKEYDVEPAQEPRHVVSPTAGFREVLQHTDWYVYRGDSRPPYRYRRYSEALNYVGASERREAHVDIGCGAGLFSWVFLDWAKRQGLEFNRVELYGLDHSREMVHLSKMVRDRLALRVAGYPDLHSVIDADSLLQEITKRHLGDTDFTITFGHVLVQANTPANIREFARIVIEIIELMSTGCNCALWAIDARGRSAELMAAWEALLGTLERAGIRFDAHDLPRTAINDGNSAKVAFYQSAY